jgi:hypothetical protein
MDTSSANPEPPNASAPSFPVPDFYSLLDLARLWATEVGSPPVQIAHSLADAMRSGNLAYEPSTEPVIVSQDAAGNVQDIWVPEVLSQALIPGARKVRLTELAPAYVADLLAGLLIEIADNPSAELRPAHRLILVGRDVFREWLAAQGYTPPQFWFPSPAGLTEEDGDPGDAGVRAAKKARTKRRDEAIRREADRLRKVQPGIRNTKLAEAIANDPRLNPAGKLKSQRVRRILSEKPMSAESQKRAQASWNGLIQKGRKA